MRLIDADAVPQEFWEYEFDGKWRGCTIKDLLDSQPTIQPDNNSENPNGSDVISRQAAIDALASMYCKSDEDGYVWIIRRDAWARIDSLSPAEPKRGKWIRDGHHIRCDQCGMYMCDTDREGDRIPTDFCPNCGAKMEVTTPPECEGDCGWCKPSVIEKCKGVTE